MEPSVFPASAFVSGELFSSGDIEIRGHAEADIECRFLCIAPQARVVGRIVARRVRVEGCFAGEIHAGAVELPASAAISGEIWYETLQIEPGASVETYCGVVDGEWDERSGPAVSANEGSVSQIA